MPFQSARSSQVQRGQNSVDYEPFLAGRHIVLSLPFDDTLDPARSLGIEVVVMRSHSDVNELTKLAGGRDAEESAASPCRLG